MNGAEYERNVVLHFSLKSYSNQYHWTKGLLQFLSQMTFPEMSNVFKKKEVIMKGVEVKHGPLDHTTSANQMPKSY